MNPSGLSAETVRIIHSNLILCLCIPLQERRREFEANLQNAGLELETEDKSVRRCPVLLCVVIGYRSLRTLLFWFLCFSFKIPWLLPSYETVQNRKCYLAVNGPPLTELTTCGLIKVKASPNND